MHGLKGRQSNNRLGVNQYTKADSPAKDEIISVRLAANLKARYQSFADAEGLPLSTWLLKQVDKSMAL